MVIQVNAFVSSSNYLICSTIEFMLYSDIYLNGKRCVCVIHQTTCISSLWWDYPVHVCCLQWSFLVNEPFCWAPEHLADYTIFTLTCLGQDFHFMTLLPRYFKFQHVESPCAAHLKYFLNWSDSTCKQINWMSGE